MPRLPSTWLTPSNGNHPCRQHKGDMENTGSEAGPGVDRIAKMSH